MMRLRSSILALAIATSALSFAQGPMRDPESAGLGYKPLAVEAVRSAAHFDEYASVFTSSTLEPGIPRWQTAPGYLRYAGAKRADMDVTKAGVEKDVLRLRTLCGTSAAFAASDSDNSKLLVKSLLGELDLYLARVDALKPFEPVPAPEPEFQVTDASLGPFSTDVVFFVGTDRQVVLGGTKKLAAPPAPGAPSSMPVYYATLEQAIEFRAVADEMIAILRQVKEKPFEQVTARLTEIDLGWTNYLERGFSQYPWESAFNSYVTPKVFGSFAWDRAPFDQIVLLHPELGFELDTRSAQGSSAQAALMVHALGYVHYFGDARDWFVGASATATFSDQHFGLGVGPTLQLGWANMSSVLPHISIGAYWHEFDSGSHGPIVGFSLDFWRLLNKDNGRGFFEAALASLK